MLQITNKSLFVASSWFLLYLLKNEYSKKEKDKESLIEKHI